MKNEFFFCTNCHYRLPEYFTIAALEQVDEDNYKYIENKVHIATLKNQKINVVCPHCESETFPAIWAELHRNSNKEKDNEPTSEPIFEQFCRKV